MRMRPLPAAIIGGVVLAAPVSAQEPVAATPIVIGQSCVLRSVVMEGTREINVWLILTLDAFRDLYALPSN